MLSQVRGKNQVF